MAEKIILPKELLKQSDFFFKSDAEKFQELFKKLEENNYILAQLIFLFTELSWIFIENNTLNNFDYQSYYDILGAYIITNPVNTIFEDTAPENIKAIPHKVKLLFYANIIMSNSSEMIKANTNIKP